MDARDQIGSLGHPASDELIGLPELATICWQGSGRLRRRAHEQRGRSRCPTRVAPYSDRDPSGARVHPWCAADECFDLFHDVLLEVQRRLARRTASVDLPPIDPARYTASVIPTVLADRARSRRVSLGLAAKPGRADGRAGKVIARLREVTPTPSSAAWYEALFRILRDYAHIEGRRGAVWPVAGLAQEKSRHDGRLREHESPAAASEIRADIRLVLEVATAAAGPDWVRQMIWQPLSTGVVAAEVPDDLLAPGGALEDQVLSGWFRREYLSRRARGVGTVDAFSEAAQVVSGRAPERPDADVIALLEDLAAGSGMPWLRDADAPVRQGESTQ